MAQRPDGSYTNWAEDLFSGLYNPEVERSRDYAFGKQRSAQSAMEAISELYQKYADDPPSLIKALTGMGLYDPKTGKLNTDKYVDTAYLKDTERQLGQTSNQAQAMAQRQAQQMAQMRGGLQSTAVQNAGVGQAMNARQQAVKDYLNRYKQERELGYQKGMGLGNSQLDSNMLGMNQNLNAAQSRSNAANNAYNNAAQYAQSQDKGLFQDPGKMMELATGIAGLFVPGAQVAGAAKIGGALTSKGSKANTMFA